MDDEDVMGVQERMINHIWCKIAENDMGLIDAVTNIENPKERTL